MTDRVVDVRGRKVQVAEIGSGPPVVYLHGFADVHGAQKDWLPFHRALAQGCRLIAPAHPGCAGSDENEDIDVVEDVAFHTLELLDALGLDKVTLVGTCIGGWIAAEMAVRYRERIDRLALIGPTGLFIPGKPIGDIFWEIQPVDGVVQDLIVAAVDFGRARCDKLGRRIKVGPIDQKHQRVEHAGIRESMSDSSADHSVVLEVRQTLDILAQVERPQVHVEHLPAQRLRFILASQRFERS